MRILQVLFSYAIAALAGSLALALISALFGKGEVLHILGSAVITAVFGMFIGGIFALPVLLATEISKLSDWRFYVVACAIAAPATIWGVNSHAMEPILTMFLIVGLCGALSGAVYWSLAWRVLEPNILSSGDP